MARRAFAALVATVLVIGQAGAALAVAAPGGTSPEALAAARVQRGLVDQLSRGERSRFIVEFAARADLAPAAGVRGFAQRGQAVLDALTRTARASQGPAAAMARDAGVTATSYWLTNVLVVEAEGRGKPQALARLAPRLAALPGVSAVRAENVYPLVKPVKIAPRIVPSGHTGLGDPEWGVARINADHAWESGILGSGIVVANVDTGVDYLHPALVNQYRGNLGGGTFEHAYSWWDPTGICGPAPCDNVGHGTHTMGTMVGGDGPGPFAPDIGVAPGAEWIAAKGCEELGCSESNLLSAGQFVLAPTDLEGGNPDPSRRPDVVNNSWGSGPGDTFYLETVQAWRAAGIIPVFASGNPGPECGAGGSPGDYEEVISAGATDDTDTIADFSGRGPSVFAKINPDVSAPGVNVTSSVPGGGFAAFNGTSMAAPHVAGTLALVLQADTSLIGNFDAARTIVLTTAVDRPDESCGGDADGDPNNVYGEGRIDAGAAVAVAATGGTLEGTVTDAATSSPIAGAEVVANNGTRDFTATTDAAGRYELFLAAGTYTVTTTAFGYQAVIATAVITANNTTVLDFSLTALPRFTVSGHVTAEQGGAAIEGALVRALGTPLPPAITDPTGAYSFELPIGTFILRASQAGCTEAVEAEVTGTTGGQAVVQDFVLPIKIDAFGHFCHPVAFDWVEAQNQTALFGDDTAGRLLLPFPFEFYGETYDKVFPSTNGFVNFLEPDATFQATPIPSGSRPNAAIYALWRDFVVIEDDSAIKYDTIGTIPGERVFVIEYENVQKFGGEERGSFEIKLHEDGRIDLLYADLATSLRGSDATIGIEDATGTDALQFSFFEPVIEPNTAFRYEVIPSGLVTGTVTDANDDLPIAGATIEADPGGRSARSRADGTYSLRLLEGDYTLTASAEFYVSASAPVSVVVGETDVVDFSLAAPTATVEPTSIEASVGFGEQATTELVLANAGSAVLDFGIVEQDRGSAPPVPPATQRVVRPPTWTSVSLPPDFPVYRPADTLAIVAVPIITDPDGDANGTVDTTVTSAGVGDGMVRLEIDFTAATPMGEVGGFMFLDTDQDPDTGVPAEAVAGKPTQDVGMEFFVDLFNIHGSEPVALIVDAATFNVVAAVPAAISGQKLAFDMPLEALGGDDGTINVAGVVGTSQEPTDWTPDVGHGTVTPFTDLPWLSAVPDAGVVAAGSSQAIVVTLGGASLQPGTYGANLIISTNAPRTRTLVVPVDLTVATPDTFGTITGTVTDAHSGDPIANATVTVHATHLGNPLELTSTTADDGTYTLLGPAGSWPADFARDGYVTVSQQVSIVQGVTTPDVDAQLHRLQPHAALDGGPFTFILLAGEQRSGSMTLSNPGGHADLTFEVAEVDLGGGLAGGSPTRRTLPAGADPNATSTRGIDFGAAPSIPPGIRAPGDVIASWPTGLDLGWGVGYTGNVWLSDVLEGGDICGTASACENHEFDPAGSPTGRFHEADWAGDFNGDMAFDRGRGLMWQVAVGADNGIHGWNLETGEVEQVITGSPWSNISQRGLAYDPVADVFYIGGWNEGIVYRVAGPSHVTPGETLSQCNPADGLISGLAWNASFGMLWASTNSETDTIYLLDPMTCEAGVAIPHPDGGGFGGAGLELDATGNLWTVGQGSGNAYLVDSGLPNFSDVPWLTVAPTSGTIAPDGSVTITLSVDSTGLEPGVYRALSIVQTNDPDAANIQVPVTLVVPHTRQGVNAGGPAYTARNGVPYAADRPFSTGSFGWVGASTRLSTRHVIAGTDDDALYQNQRVGMRAYRFTVPNGTYVVDLQFAELQLRRDFGRIFAVRIEGQTVLSGFDVFDQAGGRWIAHDRSFTVDVTDGRLDIDFIRQRGEPPAVNAILVTNQPEGAF